MMTKQLHPNQLHQAIQFSEQLTNFDSWITKANELLNAANILKVEVVKYWSEVRFEEGRVVGTPNTKIVQGPYFLLIAYFGPQDIARIDNFIDRLNKYITQEVVRGEDV